VGSRDPKKKERKNREKRKKERRRKKLKNEKRKADHLQRDLDATRIKADIKSKSKERTIKCF
jgi:hypothetical protein